MAAAPTQTTAMDSKEPEASQGVNTPMPMAALPCMARSFMATARPFWPGATVAKTVS